MALSGFDIFAAIKRREAGADSVVSFRRRSMDADKSASMVQYSFGG